MRVEGRLAIDPQDAEVFVGGKSLLSNLLRECNEGDIIRIQIDRIAHNQEPPLLREQMVLDD